MSRHLQPLDFWGCSSEKVPNQKEQRVERSQVAHPCGVGLGKGGSWVEFCGRSIDRGVGGHGAEFAVGEFKVAKVVGSVWSFCHSGLLMENI